MFHNVKFCGVETYWGNVNPIGKDTTLCPVILYHIHYIQPWPIVSKRKYLDGCLNGNLGEANQLLHKFVI